MSQMLEYRFDPDGDTLRRYMASRYRVTFIMGPLGSGKTVASCMRVFTHMTTMTPDEEGVRRSRWVAVRNTYPDLEGTTMKDWMELFGDPELGKLNKDFPPTHHLNFDMEDGTTVKAELVFMALDRPDSVRKLRGLQATGFWLNEVKELEEDIVDMCDLRHGRYPNRKQVGDYWHGMIGDTNAPDDMHWYYRKAEIDKPEGWKFLKQPGGVIQQRTAEGLKWVENPLAENVRNLPKDYYITGLSGKKESWIKVNLANQYGHIVDGKAIYADEYSDQLHISQYVLQPNVKHGNFYIGIDFGMTPAAVIAQEIGGQLRVLDELVSEGMGIRTFVRDYLKPFLKDRYKDVPLESFDCCCDPSGDDPRDTEGDSPIAILQEEGFNAYAASSNKPQTRWEAVRYFLGRNVGGRPAFLLSPTCDMLRKGFNGGYHLRRLQVSGAARFSKQAEKNAFSHCHDACQYLCMAAKGGYNFTSKKPDVTINGQRYTGSAGY